MPRVPYLLILSALCLACDTSPVDWSDPVAIVPPPGASRLVVDSSGSARLVGDTLRIDHPPSVPGLCTTSVRGAMATRHLYAGWWSVRHDSSAVLYVAPSSDGGRSWMQPIAVDTSDVGTVGCSRPPPALATVGDDVYVAYSMAAPEGMGVFAAHTMGGMLHSPVAVIYGDRLVSVAIATDGDDVAVAYEDPNGTRPQVDVALSTTQGHIFESHLTASRSVDDAAAPAVALSGHALAVSWSLKRAADGSASRVVRVGHMP